MSAAPEAAIAGGPSDAARLRCDPEPMSELRNDVRTALMTGVSKGIGRAIALRLLSDGWHVHGTYRSGRDEALALAAEHERCTVHQADVALDGDVEQLLSVLGGLPLAGLINNAGVIHFEDLDAFDLSRWRETLEVNLTAPVRLARALESNLAGGSIVNIASTDARTGAYNSIAYAVGRAGLLNTTQSLGDLLARSDIRVTPSLQGGSRRSGHRNDAAIRRAARAPLESGDVAAASAWLLSSEASFVTGTTSWSMAVQRRRLRHQAGSGSTRPRRRGGTTQLMSRFRLWTRSTISGDGS